MNENAKINVISKVGFTEFHYLVANINFDGAIDIARLLIQSGCDSCQIDSKYRNTALLSIYLEFLKRLLDDYMKFLEVVLQNHKKNLYTKQIRN